MKRHILKRCGWTSNTFDKVDWNALGEAMATFGNSHLVSLVKIGNDILPIGDTLLQQDPTENPACASCKQEPLETFAHMLICSNHEDWRKAAGADLL